MTTVIVTTERVVEQFVDLGEVARAIYDSNRSPAAPEWSAVVANVRAFVLRQARAAAEEVVRQILDESDR